MCRTTEVKQERPKFGMRLPLVAIGRTVGLLNVIRRENRSKSSFVYARPITLNAPT